MKKIIFGLFAISVILILNESINLDLRFKNLLKSIIYKIDNKIFKSIIYKIDNKIFKKKDFKTTDDNISLILIGHGYGTRNQKNKSLDERVFKIIQRNYNSKKHNIFLLGDFLKRNKISNWSDLEKKIDKLNANFYFVMGNHEEANLSYLKFFSHFQSSFSYFEHGKNVIFVLNSSQKARDITQKQINFVKKKLSKNKYKNIIFLSHHLIWWNGSDEEDKLVNNGSSKTKILQPYFYKEQLLKFLKKIETSDIYFFAGDMGNNSSFIKLKKDKIEFYGIGFGMNESTTRKFEGKIAEITLLKSGEIRLNFVNFN